MDIFRRQGSSHEDDWFIGRAHVDVTTVGKPIDVTGGVDTSHVVTKDVVAKLIHGATEFCCVRLFFFVIWDFFPAG